LQLSTEIITLMNYSTVLISFKGYYLSAKICPIIIIVTAYIKYEMFTSHTTSRLKKISSIAGRSLDRHVRLKVATHIWICKPRQKLVCCVVSVLAAM